MLHRRLRLLRARPAGRDRSRIVRRPARAPPGPRSHQGARRRRAEDRHRVQQRRRGARQGLLVGHRRLRRVANVVRHERHGRRAGGGDGAPSPRGRRHHRKRLKRPREHRAGEERWIQHAHPGRHLSLHQGCAEHDHRVLRRGAQGARARQGDKSRQHRPGVGEHGHGQPRRDGEAAAGARAGGAGDDRRRGGPQTRGQRQVSQLGRRGDAVVTRTAF
mmetsp:Transcript_13219/g.55876  ORF Transcript_13219/g.55876 Transcript_13219/m.55876 type:complete len:218 (+) Transcript_13219:199-852(+)